MSAGTSTLLMLLCWAIGVGTGWSLKALAALLQSKRMPKEPT